MTADMLVACKSVLEGAPRSAPMKRTMKRAVRARAVVTVVLAVLAPMGVARPGLADPTRLVTEPAGWRADPEQASALAQRFAAAGHFGGLPSVTAAEAYVADRPGVALFVTRATATLPDQTQGQVHAARAARAALDELRASSRRTSLTGGSAQERAWNERVEASARQVTATLSWSDPASHAAEIARVVVASDGTRIVAVTGECLAGDAADPTRIAACQACLASLDPGVGAASRIAITPDAAGPTPDATPDATPPAPRESPSSPSVPAGASREPARLDDGSKFVMPPTTIPLDRPDADRRPVFVGAGIIALAFMFWWNRRRRDRFEREDRGDVPARRSRAAGAARAARDSDEDADDLHAAARGDDRSKPDRQDP